MTIARRTGWVVAVIVAAGLAGACAARSATIAEVQSNPGYYADRQVTVTGVVTTAWAVPLVPYKLYRVSDGTAEILVVSDGRRTPGKGARVRVRGDVEEFAVFGGRSFGLHLRERDIKFM
jgi:hypothetical protein